jgi:hypothetical protein
MHSSISMRRGVLLLLLTALCVLAPVNSARAQSNQNQTDAYPKPSPFPISWELKFQHSAPKRLVITLPGDLQPTAYWYITYSVVNQADKDSTYDPERDKERIFYPSFTMRTQDGKLLTGNDGINPAVVDAIKAREGNKYAEDPTLMGGRILLGLDQERDSVAIWAEPAQRMGSFTIFATGMWGETAVAKDSDGNPIKDASGDPVILHKTLMMNYHVDGDQTHFGPVRLVSEEWIMR